jgi:hypothetical protein
MNHEIHISHSLVADALKQLAAHTHTTHAYVYIHTAPPRRRSFSFRRPARPYQQRDSRRAAVVAGISRKKCCMMVHMFKLIARSTRN